MGIVYRAYQPAMEREVAVKVLPPALAADSRLLQRFRNEVKIAGSLMHAHILSVHDVREVDGVPVLIMPLIEGATLGRIVRDRAGVKKGQPIDNPHPYALVNSRQYLERILPLLDQLVSAVAALHQAAILHRDIKPSNALVEVNGHPW